MGGATSRLKNSKHKDKVKPMVDLFDKKEYLPRLGISDTK